jgi:hypothetical protein
MCRVPIQHHIADGIPIIIVLLLAKRDLLFQFNGIANTVV